MGTNFRHGLQSMGVPVMGGSIGYGWKGDSTTWFVDGTNGSDANTGEEPTRAFATIQKAIDSASKFDVIYVFDKDLADYGDSTGKYTEVLTVAKQKHNLSIIGCSQLKGWPVRECGIYGVSGSPVIEINAGSLTLENLKFGFNTGVTHAAVAEAGESDTRWGHNPVFYNCRFGGFTGTADRNAAIKGTGLQGIQIINCLFVDNYVDINIMSGAGTSSDIRIIGNTFSINAAAASSKSADIYINTQGSSYVDISYNRFAHLIPSAGLGRYVLVADARQGCLSYNSFSTGYNNNLTIGTAGTGCKVPNALNSGPNWGNSALMAASA